MSDDRFDGDRLRQMRAALRKHEQENRRLLADLDQAVTQQGQEEDQVWAFIRTGRPVLKQIFQQGAAAAHQEVGDELFYRVVRKMAWWSLWLLCSRDNRAHAHEMALDAQDRLDWLQEAKKQLPEDT
jgi:hypothetical protein